MRKNCGFIVGMSNETIKKVIERFSLKAFADEPSEGDKGDSQSNTTGDEPSEGDKNKPTPTINYEDLIAKARREEKEKQYGTIQKLKGQINTLTEQHNNDLLKVADLEKKLEEANTKLTKVGEGDSEEIKTLKNTISILEQEKKDLETENSKFKETPPVSKEEVEKEVRAELEAEYEVKTYKATKLAELKDEILVPELVMGDTVEEIDKSIESALERSAEIKKNLGITEGKKNKRTPKSPSNPSVSGVQDNEVSLERLATMDVGSEEYAKLRKQLGLR